MKNKQLNKLFLILLLLLVLAVLFFLVSKNIFKSSPKEIPEKRIETGSFNDQMLVSKYDKNPIMSADALGWEDKKHVAGNCVFADETGNTKMIYYSSSSVYPNTALGIAESTDGIHFEKNPDPILKAGDEGEWDSGGVEVSPNCIIKKNNGEYMIFYTGYKKGSVDIYHAGQIGLATSKDLKNWKKYEKNPILTAGPQSGWDSWAVIEPSVYFNGNEYGQPGSYEMWYTGSNPELRFKIGYASSKDGYNWQKHPSPVFEFSNIEPSFDKYSVEVHSVNRIYNGYFLFYEAIEDQFPNRFRIGAAYSTDGISWKRSAINPILFEGPVNSWDYMGVYHPSFIYNGKDYLLYYVGLNYSYDHQIGVAKINPDLFLDIILNK